MMYSEIIDEVDFFEHLKKQVPSIIIDSDTSLVGALQQASSLASTKEWQEVTQWLSELTTDMNILLPEIQIALKAPWCTNKILPTELQKKLS